LGADLLGDRLSVGRDRTGMRGGYVALEVQPCDMFGRLAIAASPRDGALLDDRVQPRLADFPR
jgi:hypothetical protein